MKFFITSGPESGALREDIIHYCNVCEESICKLVYLFIVFGEHGGYIGNINHLW